MAAKRTANQGNANQGTANKGTGNEGPANEGIANERIGNQSTAHRGTGKQRTVFLAALEQGYSVTFARKKAGLDRATVKAWRSGDDGFAEAWDAAVEAGTDLLEDLARERVATGGDSLLMFLLKSRRPEKYRERHDHQVDAGIASGVLIAPASIDLETWVDQAARQMAKAQIAKAQTAKAQTAKETARLAADQTRQTDDPAWPTRAGQAAKAADGASRTP